VTAAARVRQEIGTGLGASEIAAACGIDPYRSPLQLWLEHTGQCEPFAGNEFTEWGLLVEPALLSWYEGRHVLEGEEFHRPESSRYHEDHSWARATPDAIVLGSSERTVQAKNVGYRMAHRWDQGPPDYVEVQCQWECLVTGLRRSDVVASVGGTPPQLWTVWRDEAMIADLLAVGERHWRHVRDRTEPRTTHHEDWAAHLARRAKSRGFIVPVDSVDPNLLEEWRASTLALKSAEKRSDLAKNRVRRFLADANADGMETSDGMAMWKPDRNGKRALRTPRGWGGEEK